MSLAVKTRRDQGSAASEALPVRKVQNVSGSARRSPPILRDVVLILQA